MFASKTRPIRQNPFRARRWLLAAVFAALAAITFKPAHTQDRFDSRSTGADGAFNPTTNMTIIVPESGVFNYTSVNIPAGVRITYHRNPQFNKPVEIRATQNVTIGGGAVISVEGATAGFAGGGNSIGGNGGPGGFNGGRGGAFNDRNDAAAGDGPGGGGGGRARPDRTECSGGAGAGHLLDGQRGGRDPALEAMAGPLYGGKTLLPLVGGSGGGGGGACDRGFGGGGGGGGGAILIASSGTISFTGSNAIINAIGGNGSAPTPVENARGGGGGSGGAIRLIANTITGAPILNVRGGAGGDDFAGRGSPGYISVEAFNLDSFSPAVIDTPGISYARPGLVMPANLPTLRIASVGGMNAPANPRGSFGAVLPDISLPASQTNPVQVSIQAANIPTGSIVRVIVVQESGTRVEVNSAPLAGTFANSTATASVTLPNGVSVVMATISVNAQLALGRPLFINGERVDRMEVAASFGRDSELVFITQSGRRVRSSEL